MLRFANVRADLFKFAKKNYRDGFLETTTRAGIALQIKALRQKFGLSQDEFAAKLDKKQSVISRLEDPERSKASVQTLLDIASGCDVALVVRFVSYPEFLAQTSDMSPEGLQADTIMESLEAEAVAPENRTGAPSELYARLGGQQGFADDEPKQNRLVERASMSRLGLQDRAAQYLAHQN